jgi:PUA domain protein
MPVLPMLRLLHKFPFMMDAMQCDKGAIRHIFSGSHVMAPGITSAGGKLHPGLDVLAPV